MKYNTIEQLATKLLAICLFIFISIALVGSLFDIPHLVLLGDNTLLILVIEITGVLFLVSFLRILYTFVANLPQKYELILCIFSMLLVTIIQFLVIKYFEIRPIEDLNKVTNMAIDLVNGMKFTNAETYFSMYTNNIAFTLYLSKYFKFMIGLGFRNYTMAGSLLGIVALNLSLVITSLILKKIKGRKSAVFFLVFNIFNPLIYLWETFFYTTIIAIPFMMSAIYIIVLLQRENRLIYFSIKAALLASVLYIGTQIRATTSFVFLGAIVFFILKCIAHKPNRAQLLTLCKKLLYGTVVAALCLLLIHSGYEKMYQQSMEADYSQTSFPFTHWIMMGLRDNGSFNWLDEEATSMQLTKTDKISYNLEEIRNRINNLGPLGITKVIVNKIIYTWADGSHDYPVIMRASHNYTNLHKYILGEKRDLIILYFQIFNIAVLLFLLINTVCLFKRKALSFDLLIYIILFGGFLFHILWEANPKYSLNFIMLVLLISNDSLVEFFHSESLSHNFHKFVQNFGVVFVLLGMVISLILYPRFTKDTFVYNDLVQGQLVSNKNAINDMEQGAYFTQSYHTKRPFNNISIQAYNGSNSFDAKYLAELLDDNQNTLFQTTFSPTAQNRVEIIDFDFDTIAPEKPRTFYIRISSDNVKPEQKIAFRMSLKPGYDVFPHGNLVINDQEVDGDLAFSVNDKVMDSYTNPFFYLCIVGFILFTELFIWFYYYNYNNNNIIIQRSRANLEEPFF